MSKIFKVIIAGGRDFDDYGLLARSMDKILSKRIEAGYTVQIVCGMAKGADLIGKEYAEDTGFEVIEMPADWDKYGKRAGYVRNAQMAEIADACVAFWDQKSRGTAHMIQIARDKGIPVRIVSYSKTTIASAAYPYEDRKGE